MNISDVLSLRLGIHQNSYWRIVKHWEMQDHLTTYTVVLLQNKQTKCMWALESRHLSASELCASNLYCIPNSIKYAFSEYLEEKTLKYIVKKLSSELILKFSESNQSLKTESRCIWEWIFINSTHLSPNTTGLCSKLGCSRLCDSHPFHSRRTAYC